MNSWFKFALGLGAACLCGWASHGPGGRGAALLDQIDASAARRVAAVRLPDLAARTDRDPMRRVVLLSGATDTIQREGFGSFPGINERMETIPGVSGIEWTTPLVVRPGD